MKKLITLYLMLYSIYSNGQALLDKSKWYLFKSDEFNYTSSTQLFKNWTSGWPWGTCQKDVCNLKYADLPNNLVLDGNFLHIKAGPVSTPYPCGDSTNATFGTASIWSKFTDSLECTQKDGFMHGMFEARLKMAKGNGMYSSFWLTGQTAWPPEIDVFEYNGRSPKEIFSTPRWTSSNYQAKNINCFSNLSISTGIKTLTIPSGWTIEEGQELLLKYDDSRKMIGSIISYDNSTGNSTINVTSIVGSGTFNQWKVDCKNGSCAVSTFIDKNSTGGFDDEFHTYTCVWSPNEITWFFDGKEYRREARQFRIPQADCRWRKMMPTIGLAANCLDNANQTGEMVVDYFRVYKPLSTNTSWNHFQNNYKTIDNSAHLLYPAEPANTAQKKIFVVNGAGNVYYIGTDFRLWNYYWNGSSFSSTPINWNVTDVSDDITNDAPNSKIYYRSTANTLKYFQGGNSYTAVASSLCAGFIDIDQYGGVYYKGTNGFLYYAKLNSGSYSNIKITNASNVKGKICYVSSTNTIYYRGTDNNLWKTIFNASTNTWSAAVRLTTNAQVTDHLIWAGDRLFYSGIDKRIYNFYFDGANWQNNCLSWASDDANCVGELAYDYFSSVLYYKGDDDRLWYFFTDNGWGLQFGGNWYNSATNNIVKVGGAITARNDGTIYFRGVDSKIYENWLQPSQMTNILGNLSTTNNNIVFKTEQESELNSISSDTTKNNSFFIYPNPTSNNIIFELGIENESQIEISIFNMYGSILEKHQFNSFDRKFTIDLSNKPIGVYFYSFMINGESKTGKFEKIR